MKQLYIIRHGDSPIMQGGNDFERPLSEMGKYDAINIGLHLNEDYPLPSYILSSAAKRAIATARIIGEELEFDTTKITSVKGLHNAPMETVLAEINQISANHECIMVFGHNPGLSMLASYLTGENFNLETCNTVLLNVEIDEWAELTKGTCTVNQYIAP
jgi:phosphohistidine phosphatase